MKHFLTLLFIACALTASVAPLSSYAQALPQQPASAGAGGVAELGNTINDQLGEPENALPIWDLSWENVVGLIGKSMLSIAGVFTWAGATVLNASVNLTVVNMGT